MPEFFDILDEVMVELINNAVLLFALAFVYGATNFKPDSRQFGKKVFLGLMIGGVAILIMKNPWALGEGLIFDTRSVLLSVTGAFFGPVTTIIAGLIAAVYRIFVGGAGVYAGVATIVVTSGLGIAWFYAYPKFKNSAPFIRYWLFGLVVSFHTLLCQLLIPWPLAFEVISDIAVPFLVVFPVVSSMLSIAIRNQILRLNYTSMLKNQKLLLQASIDSSRTMEIFAVDRTFNYLAYNEFHVKSMKKYYGKDISPNSCYLDFIEDEHMHYRIENFLKQALGGESFTRVVEVETARGKYLEEIYTPIRGEENEIIGVTVFSQEITQRKQYEENILYLSYHDPLTGLYNRRYYTEQLLKLHEKEHMPLSIVMGDINGLKVMNDAFGHDAGDELLKTVAKELTKVFEEKGQIARIGGDEFVILLPNMYKQAAIKLIDEAKALIEQNSMNGITLSVSFGVDTLIDVSGSASEVIKNAEDDMYKHKLFEVSSNRNESIRTILHTLHIKNPREEFHSKRVSEYCVEIGTILGMRPSELDLLKIIGNLHDIGKIGIDESILNKPGTLTSEEWGEIKRHPEIGYRILTSSPEYNEIALDILSHHERWDGSGYPQGLKGKDIPYRSRIIAIADAFDAMTTSRPYRDAMTMDAALEEIKKNAGTQFDPTMAVKFVEYYRKGK